MTNLANHNETKLKRNYVGAQVCTLLDMCIADKGL